MEDKDLVKEELSEEENSHLEELLEDSGDFEAFKEENEDPEDVSDGFVEDMFEMKYKDKVIVKQDREKKYSMIPKLTQQFRFCGNPFRIDCYKGCDFGCKYCFANASNLLGRKGWQTGDIAQLERFMARALEKDSEGNYVYPTNSLSMECIRHRVPFHCGGLSDPFQDREWELGVTYRLLQLSRKYNYPIVFSTKGIIKDPKYWEVMDPKIHAFQLSIISKDTEFLHKYETNTASAEERLAFARELHSKGFWTGIRIQPCIELQKALELVEDISGDVDYITVEHLKIDVGNPCMQVLFKEQIESGDYKRISTMLFEMKAEKKIRDIEAIKKVSKCKIGVGDNDLHYLSDTDCCCGIDTMGENFDNWIKYNMTYFSHHKDVDKCSLWSPKQSCRECFFKGSFGSKVDLNELKDIDFRQYVEEYCRRHPDFMGRVDSYKFDLFEGFGED